MRIDLTECHTIGNADDQTSSTLSIVIVYDKEPLHELCTQLDEKRYAITSLAFAEARDALKQIRPSLIISSLSQCDQLIDLLNYIQGHEQVIHISLTDGALVNLLSDAVAQNKLYKFLISPIEAATLEAHIIEAHQELCLRTKRKALLAEINDFTNQLDILDKKLQSSQASKPQLLINHPQIDPLTSLPNRYLIFDRIHQAINLAKRKNNMVAVLSIDLDRFAAINQSLGLRYGNQLLRNFAQRLVSCSRQSDSVAREGNDEFLLVMPDIENSESVIQLVKRIQQSLARPFLINNLEIFITASIGICIYPNDADDPETLVRAANAAMKHAKQLGGNSYQYFEKQMNSRIRKLVDMESSLFRALEKNEFVMYYQPQVDVKSGKIVGAEALIRWLRPEHGIIAPNEFIPILEETGLIEQVGEWILHNVSEQSDRWRSDGLPPLRMSINLSLRQVQDDAILKSVEKLLSKSQTTDRAQSIELEITESVMMKDANKAIMLLLELNKMGFNLAIDDFGTGYASLNYLTRFPVHSLKIDLSFVQRIETSDKDAAIVKAIIAMAHGLGLRVTAEGVETQQQLNFLSECECDEIQGYLFSKPLPAREFEALVRSDKRLTNDLISK
jgi:polar amino acid transport system substrate-binding protein